MKYVATVNDRTYVIEIKDEHHVLVEGVEHEIDFVNIGGQPVHTLLVDGQSHEAFIYEGEAANVWEVLLHGALYTAIVEDERERRLRAAAGSGAGTTSGEFSLKAPMPGLVVAVPVVEGQEVKKGDNLVILESMKMQNELKSPRDGVVARVKAAPGDSVEHHQVLMIVA